MRARAARVEDLMTKNPQTCRPEDSLSRAAEILWDSDVGCAPVVDGDEQLAGLITDRDICMAAYTRGGRLSDYPVASVMSREPISCESSEGIDIAQDKMRSRQIRRIVAMENGRVVGVLSLNDLALAARDQRGVSREDVAETLASICEHRPEQRMAMSA